MVFAQQANYFILGAEQFRGIQIYDVIQDIKSDYWFATNNGIYQYDFYKYTKIECDNSKSNSVFNFVINEEGTIYCHNLNNQVFQIKDDKCSLFYELESKDGSSDISLAIVDEQLIIAAKNVIALNKNGKVINRFTNKLNYYLGPPFLTKSKELHYYLAGGDSILLYSKGKFSTHKLNYPKEKLPSDCVFKFYGLNNFVYALDLKSKSLFNYNPDNFTIQDKTNNEQFKRSESVRIYETTNEIWIAGTLPGIFKWTNNEAQNNSSINYPDYFISDVFKDAEGNILLSTFDKGVLVIPDLNLPDVINSFATDPISSLYVDEELGLVLGSSEGKLMNYKNKLLNTIDTNGKRPIENIYGFPGSDFILFDDGHIRAFNKSTNEFINLIEGSLKDVAFKTAHLFYLGTNSGITKCIWKSENDFYFEKLTDLNYWIFRPN